jgi:diguanylate cyclase (GGDEF)-like protein
MTSRLLARPVQVPLDVDLSTKRPPRLILRFALYTGIGLALAAASMLLFVRHLEQSRTEESAVLRARVLVDNLASHLRTTDFGQPVGAKRRTALDRLVKRSLLAGDAARFELIGDGGVVTYSTDRARIGADAVATGISKAASTGTLVSEFGTIDSGADTLDVLNAYAPVRLDGRAPGVVSVTQDAASIAAAARRTIVPIVVVFEALLIGLYISLFPILRAVTGRLRRQIETIRHQALHDPLTGLPNRTYFAARLEEALADDGTPRAAVMLIDLDCFKEVNDTLGHGDGDRLLQELGQRLLHAIEGDEFVARLGGDEFGVISPRATDGREAIRLAERLRTEIAEPFDVGGISLEVQASVGIALVPDHGDNGETLLRRADLAMYAAKPDEAPVLYEPALDGTSPLRLALAAELRRAIEEGELIVYYQPQVALDSREVRGVEALVRWRHPQRGFLSPDEFLPVAEQAGLMRSLTRAVLDDALRRCRIWHNSGIPLEVAVNVSGRDIVDLRLPEQVARALAEHGVDPSFLQLEISESAVMGDSHRCVTVIGELAALGVRIAIDDFGVGYSSLGQLRRLPVSVLKIDKSFVQSMADERAGAVIVSSTIDLAHSLGLEVVAEGVEDEATIDRLGAARCDLVQGYAISRPLPAEDLTAWLANAKLPARRDQADVIPLLQRATRAAGGDA